MEQHELMERSPNQSVATFELSLEAMQGHLNELKKFVSSLLVEDKQDGKGGDYGKIKGCGNKPTLLKPGAEKLQKVFGFKMQMTCTNYIIDFEKPLGLYEYKCSIGKYDNDGKFYAFAECEGIAHTEETKYKYKWEGYNNNRKQIENTERMSLLNTIKKMAQKRAYVGAMLAAAGASEYYTQDIEDNPAQYQKKDATPTIQQLRAAIGKKFMTSAGGLAELASYLCEKVTGCKSAKDLTKEQLASAKPHLNDIGYIKQLIDDFKCAEVAAQPIPAQPYEDEEDLPF